MENELTFRIAANSPKTKKTIGWNSGNAARGQNGGSELENEAS
jgi:hypothetical protein